MLTKTDLQQIQKTVKQEVQSEGESTRRETTTQIIGLRDEIREEFKPIKKDLKSLKSDVRHLRKTVDILVKRTDEEDVRLRKRIERVKNHVGIQN